MIQNLSFLGIPLRTRLQRRLLVALFYSFVAFFEGVILWRGVHPGVAWSNCCLQIFFLGGLLGGIKTGGPVRTFEPSSVPVEGHIPNSLVGLHLTEGKQPVVSPSWLDERERAQRDHAHYIAFRILRLSVGIAVLVFGVLYFEMPAPLIARAPALFWAAAVYVLSLPQAVLLWTEPVLADDASLQPLHA